jgi:glucosylceramidase
METESECGDGSNDWAAAMHTFDLIQHYFNLGANSYMYWNIVLDETGKSNWGWKQNSLVSIDRGTKKITYHPEFYLIKLFSANIRPGAVKLSVDPEENTLAFQNPNGEVVVILRNQADNIVEKKIGYGQKVYQVNLDPNSITALFLK